MHFSPARLAITIAAAALIALPGSATAQSNPPQNPPSQPPSQPPTQSQPQPQPQPQAQPPAAAPAGQIDANAAKQHLTEARDSLSQLASMPEAAKLQGDARTKVSELISNFNALITAQTDWRASYAKVNDSLTALLGPDNEQPAAAGTAGTTGTAPAPNAVQLDPAIRGKLVEFRTHLKAFEKSAGGAEVTSASSAAGSASSAASPASSASGSMPPSAATSSTANPANPASNPSSASQGTAGTSGTAGTAGTSGTPETGTVGTSGTAGTSGTPRSASGSNADANVNAAAQSELAAIDAILAKSKTGALTKTQTAELKRHIEALRSLLK